MAHINQKEGNPKCAELSRDKNFRILCVHSGAMNSRPHGFAFARFACSRRRFRGAFDTLTAAFAGLPRPAFGLWRGPPLLLCIVRVYGAAHLARGQNPKPVPPVNIRFNPKIGSKMGGAPTPKWDPIGVDPQLQHSRRFPAPSRNPRAD